MNKLLLLLLLSIFFFKCKLDNKQSSVSFDQDPNENSSTYVLPDTTKIPEGPEGDMIRYGLALVRNTAYYIGPDGVAGNFLGNKMNCTNCHLDAGTRPHGFNFYSTYGNYPQYRSREDAVLTMEQRVNNCVERPHNGKPLPLDSKEMVAIVTYIKFLGTGMKIGEKAKISEAIEITFPNRAADPMKGKEIFMRECISCHMEDGLGKWWPDSSGYEYPPLWGSKGYQPGSSMFRIIKAARFIKANMPFDKASWENPVLTDEEAFDVAAYINSSEHIRPVSNGRDYKDPGTKYVDYPFGPYNDPFPEDQHKFGPFQPIIDYRKDKGLYLKY